ncbi:unnamed protein product [Callosobruchus maculatus]|uniref:No apical meristem-associated C-terminal domain-containing protein n=1 Tax=Callosobruchus maculatus TaxID=64391 RepID=A0A653BIF9_CALMS|nr:unnamed protein product [Callosobruchus maculatus]
MKQKVRKDDSDKKKYMLKTGGGPPMNEPSNNDNDPLDLVRSIVPGINLELDNPWDSVAVHVAQQGKHEVVHHIDHDYQKSEPIPCGSKSMRSLEPAQREEKVVNMENSDEGEHDEASISQLDKKKKKPMKRQLVIENEAQMRIKKIKKEIENNEKIYELRKQLATEEIELCQIKKESALLEKEYWKRMLEKI